MMASMPGVQAQHLLQRQNPSVLRMPEAASEIGRIHRAQYSHPTKVKRVEQLQRYFDWNPPRICELGPRGFVVRLDRRLVFGERELEAGVGVEMAVGYVMYDLFHGPSARTVSGLELVTRHSRNS